MAMELHKYDSYKNQSIPFVFNREIIEYDMKDAGYSLCREFNLLDEVTLDKLSRYEKKSRTIEIGQLQRKDRDLKDKLKDGFIRARELFFEANDLEPSDIISIKTEILLKKNTLVKL